MLRVRDRINFSVVDISIVNKSFLQVNFDFGAFFVYVYPLRDQSDLVKLVDTSYRCVALK